MSSAVAVSPRRPPRPRPRPRPGRLLGVFRTIHRLVNSLLGLLLRLLLELVTDEPELRVAPGSREPQRQGTGSRRSGTPHISAWEPPVHASSSLERSVRAPRGGHEASPAAMPPSWDSRPRRWHRQGRRHRPARPAPRRRTRGEPVGRRHRCPAAPHWPCPSEVALRIRRRERRTRGRIVEVEVPALGIAEAAWITTRSRPTALRFSDCARPVRLLDMLNLPGGGRAAVVQRAAAQSPRRRDLPLSQG